MYKSLLKMALLCGSLTGCGVDLSALTQLAKLGSAPEFDQLVRTGKQLVLSTALLACELEPDTWDGRAESCPAGPDRATLQEVMGLYPSLLVRYRPQTSPTPRLSPSPRPTPQASARPTPVPTPRPSRSPRPTPTPTRTPTPVAESTPASLFPPLVPSPPAETPVPETVYTASPL
ncbi:MAG: hypothetical protein ACO1RX_23015 [Candidatus Sericytochromatia bacterium]